MLLFDDKANTVLAKPDAVVALSPTNPRGHKSEAYFYPGKGGSAQVIVRMGGVDTVLADVMLPEPSGKESPRLSVYIRVNKTDSVPQKAVAEEVL